ncbi:MAG: hypothetical protein HN405_03640 [Planctomycetes bacterium]|mgnify:CR=1 FL=1|nr:hypothetical protein [Planctomycetota bacterium]MBT4029800.1 hypothetical protein [Planctomycetota bacterium]MBT4559894.1 hypothetical protein [Planctomycetota bacterium]MBT5102019.1 hypothetical protein [Planctomycetota bacterium]MBT7012743.1 hypothetical protein [Planctomycetota bacterium]
MPLSLPAPLLPFGNLLRTSARDLLQVDAPLWVTRAPGCLDAVGGPGEAFGSASITVATTRAVFSGIQNREDDKIFIRFIRPKSHGGDQEWSGVLSDIYTKKGPPRSLAVLRDMFETADAPWMMKMMATMIGLRRTHQLNTPKVGFVLIVWDNLPDIPGMGGREAVSVSTAMAFKASTGLDIKRVDGIRVARAVSYGEKEVFGVSLPMTKTLTCALAQPGTVLHIEHGLDPKMHWVPLPDQSQMVAIDTGFGVAVPEQDRAAAEAGAAMGLEHLNKALKAAKEDEVGGWGMIAPSKFEGGLRNHVPTKENGREWLKKFPKVDELVREAVDSEHGYRERALSEHQCREAGRARRLVLHFSEHARTKREELLAESGRVLNSSHRSLREKCSITHDGVAAFQKKITDVGRKGGLFGSRMAEAGESSIVLVFAHATGPLRVRELAAEFAKEANTRCQVFPCNGQGGVLSGWWEGILEPPAPPKKVEPDDAEESAKA